jgi:hypothetical protein
LASPIDVFASRWESRLGAPKGTYAVLALRERGVEIGIKLKKACRTVQRKENAEKRPALVADRKSHGKCPFK